MTGGGGGTQVLHGAMPMCVVRGRGARPLSAPTELRLGQQTTLALPRCTHMLAVQQEACGHALPAPSQASGEAAFALATLPHACVVAAGAAVAVASILVGVVILRSCPNHSTPAGPRGAPSVDSAPAQSSTTAASKVGRVGACAPGPCLVGGQGAAGSPSAPVTVMRAPLCCRSGVRMPSPPPAKPS